MISCRVHNHAPIKIDRLTAINVIVTSAKIEDRHSPQNLKMTTFTKNVRRPIVPMDIKNDFIQNTRSRSDQIDRLTALNVKVISAKNGDRHSP